MSVAQRLLRASGHADRASFSVADATDGARGEARGPWQGVICAMLAEHLPAPQSLFDAIARQLSADGLVFLSTALESAQRDHVFEFHEESEPVRMAERAGLRVVRLVSDVSAPAGGRFLPRATAMILQPRANRVVAARS